MRNQKAQLNFHKNCCYFEICDKQLSCYISNSNCQQMKNISVEFIVYYKVLVSQNIVQNFEYSFP